MLKTLNIIIVLLIAALITMSATDKNKRNSKYMENTNQEAESAKIVYNPHYFITVTQGSENFGDIEIELYPEKVNESQFTKVRLLIDKDKNQLYLVQYFSKDANRVTIEIQKITPNEAMTDNMFTFDKTKYPKVEVVDMRQ